VDRKVTVVLERREQDSVDAFSTAVDSLMERTRFDKFLADAEKCLRMEPSAEKTRIMDRINAVVEKVRRETLSNDLATYQAEQLIEEVRRRRKSNLNDDLTQMARNNNGVGAGTLEITSVETLYPGKANRPPDETSDLSFEPTDGIL
jgi:hypothetical protein